MRETKLESGAALRARTPRRTGSLAGLLVLGLACQSTGESDNPGGTGGGAGNHGDGGDTGQMAGAGEGGDPGSPDAQGGSGGGMEETGGTGTTGGQGGGPASGGSGGTPVGGKGGAGGTPAGGKGGTGGAPASACKTNVFCDDFETQTVGQAPGTLWNNVTQSNATVTVANDQHVSGTRSVKISIKAGDGAEGIFAPIAPGFFPAADLYARMMVRLDGAPGGSGLHWTWMKAGGATRDESGGAMPFATHGIGGHQSQLQNIMLGLLANANDGFQDCWNHSSEPVPTRAWACVEWHLNAATNLHELWIDGRAIGPHTYSLTPKGSNGCLNDRTGNKWFIGPTSLFRIGWTHYHTLGQARTMWIDDVALDTKKIGCPPK